MQGRERQLTVLLLAISLTACADEKAISAGCSAYFEMWLTMLRDELRAVPLAVVQWVNLIDARVTAGSTRRYSDRVATWNLG